MAVYYSINKKICNHSKCGSSSTNSCRSTACAAAFQSAREARRSVERKERALEHARQDARFAIDNLNMQKRLDERGRHLRSYSNGCRCAGDRRESCGYRYRYFWENGRWVLRTVRDCYPYVGNAHARHDWNCYCSRCVEKRRYAARRSSQKCFCENCVNGRRHSAQYSHDHHSC